MLIGNLNFLKEISAIHFKMAAKPGGYLDSNRDVSFASRQKKRENFFYQNSIAGSESP